MRQKLVTMLTVIGAVTVLVLAGNSVAYAATGGKFFLGKTNKAGKASVLKRTTNGTALGIVTKRTTDAPLAVNGKGKVANLNADSIDGLDSSALRTHGYVFTHQSSTADSSFYVNMSSVPNGTYLVNYSAFLNGASDTSKDASCYVYRTITANSQIYFVTTAQSNIQNANGGLTGSGIITKVPGSTLTFYCESDNNFTIQDGQVIGLHYHQPAEVILTPMVVSGGNPNARSYTPSKKVRDAQARLAQEQH